jgi:hypothetical protein
MNKIDTALNMVSMEIRQHPPDFFTGWRNTEGIPYISIGPPFLRLQNGDVVVNINRIMMTIEYDAAIIMVFKDRITPILFRPRLRKPFIVSAVRLLAFLGPVAPMPESMPGGR